MEELHRLSNVNITGCLCFNGFPKVPLMFCFIGVECGQPQEILNGTFSLTGVYYGDEATYQCNQGYALEGQEVTRCEKTGLWEQRPNCRRKENYTNKHQDFLHKA